MPEERPPDDREGSDSNVLVLPRDRLASLGGVDEAAREARAREARAAKPTAAQRRLDVLLLRRDGATFRAIGEALGISHTAAHRHYRKALGELREKTAETAEEVRQLELLRLDRLTQALMARAREGELGAVDRVLKISEARRRLLGLDAATEARAIGVSVRPGSAPSEPAEVRVVWVDDWRTE